MSSPIRAFPGGSVVKNLPANAGERPEFHPWSGTSPGEGNGNLLQYSRLENPMDRGAWWATVCGVAKSWTWLSTHSNNNNKDLFRLFPKNDGISRSDVRLGGRVAAGLVTESDFEKASGGGITENKSGGRNWVFIYTWGEVKVTQLCPTLCNPMDYTVYEILQARVLEWAAFPFSRGSSQPRDQTQVGGFFTSWAMREAPKDRSIIWLNTIQSMEFSKPEYWRG